MLKFSPTQRYMYWLQDKSTEKDEEVSFLLFRCYLPPPIQLPNESKITELPPRERADLESRIGPISGGGSCGRPSEHGGVHELARVRD